MTTAMTIIIIIIITRRRRRRAHVLREDVEDCTEKFRKCLSDVESVAARVLGDKTDLTHVLGDGALDAAVNGRERMVE